MQYQLTQVKQVETNITKNTSMTLEETLRFAHYKLRQT